MGDNVPTTYKNVVLVPEISDRNQPIICSADILQTRKKDIWHFFTVIKLALLNLVLGCLINVR